MSHKNQPRAEALAAGLKQYQHHAPCVRCNGYTRYVSSRMCVSCDRKRVKHNFRNVPKHREGRDRRNREYAAAHKPKLRKYMQEWQRSNRGKVSHYASKRRAALLERTPPWADLDAIAAFYEACPEGYHVDHIIPLQGKCVSGLHVLNNLQYLTKARNHSKNNKYDPEVYPEQRLC